ncbi:MAG: TetR/AcrR family transcriptional regulator [Alphaproteobacteria bacterium]|nr:TetR/AcrR family transcriptional regulator [Alphaproteobacteria bacterium]
MRGTKDQTRLRIVDAAYESFWRSGYTRTSVDVIAARAAITKRTLYAHFRSKDDLLAAVMERYEELALERIQKIGARLPTDRDGIIASLFGQLADWANRTPRWTGPGFTRLVMELADLPGHPARAIARRAKTAMERWIATRLTMAGVARPRDRAREVVLLMEGSMALMLIHGDRCYIDAAASAARRLVRRTGHAAEGSRCAGPARPGRPR